MDAVTPMPISCPHCSAAMPDSAVFCPGCGHSMQTPEPAQAKIGILRENVAGALAYPYAYPPPPAYYAPPPGYYPPPGYQPAPSPYYPPPGYR